MSANTDNPKATGVFSGLLRGAALRTYLGRRKLATVTAAALALVVGYHVAFGHNGLTVYWQKRQVARELGVRRLELETENARLRAHVDSLQSDPDAIEHQARETLHYTRPGEVIYTMQDVPGDSSSKKN